MVDSVWLRYHSNKGKLNTKMNAMKVVVLGPCMSGKTMLANCLADAKENSSEDYRPTQGCRILEFRLDKTKNSLKNQSVDIQLWDCSGDMKFESCWPAIAKDAAAVLLVYEAANEDQLNDLQKILQKWQNFADLSNARYLVVARKWNLNGSISTARKGMLSRLSKVEWDIDRDSLAVQSEFATFVKGVIADINQKREEEETVILRG